jgi:hypothetical protein
MGPLAQQINERGGFAIVVSEADGDQVPQQITDAIAYLKANTSRLMPVVSHGSVEDRYLDFAWWFPVRDAGPAAQFCHFPQELLALCAELRLGLEVSVYAAAEDGDAE